MNNPFDTQESPAEQTPEDIEAVSNMSGQPTVGGTKRKAPGKKVMLIILVVLVAVLGGGAFVMLSSGDAPSPKPVETALTPPAPLTPPSDAGAAPALALPADPLAAPVAPVIAPIAVAPVTAPVAPVAAPTSAPVAPLGVSPVAAVPAAVAAPAMDPCEQRMTDYAVQNGADPKAYIAQNQAYLVQCRQAVAAGAK